MSNSFEPGVSFAELSDTGMRRTNNQDSLVCVPARSAETYQNRGHLFVVADGMGAHAAGELASRMATDQIAQHYSRLAETTSIPAAVHESMARANHDIFARGQSNADFHNMGTTACALVISPGGATIGHVGDSRVYRLRGDMLEQMTFDHSLVWELEAGGQISAAGAANIPKNVITRSLGPSPEVQIDLEGPLQVEVGDCFLLCSDGLTGPVSDEEIASLMGCMDEKSVARVLVDLANLRGGPDNISVIVVRVTDAMIPTTRRSIRSGGDKTVATTLGIVAAIGLVAAVCLALAGMLGPMIVAILLAAIAGGFAFFNYQSRRSLDEIPLPDHGGGRGPYRRYPVRYTEPMADSLAHTIEQLRVAARDRGWSLDQAKITDLASRWQSELDKKQWKTAIELQAEAIVETMHQLRCQNDRIASDTAVRQV